MQHFTQHEAQTRNAAEFYFDVISSKYEEAAVNAKVPATWPSFSQVSSWAPPRRRTCTFGPVPMSRV